MAHFHGVIDADKHFVIDAATREITNQSDKITLMQNDHNSERFTFEIPREIDGHDMSLCNVVRVHYLNIDTTTKAQNPGFYEVDDLQISPDDNKKIIGSWLISANATKNVGNLNFTIRFKCIADDGSIEYAWSSAIFKGISVGQSYNNSGTVAEEYADIFAQWQARIEALEQGNSGSGLTEEQAAEIAANTEARHEHNNKGVLDSFKVSMVDAASVDYNGNMLALYSHITNAVSNLRKTIDEKNTELYNLIKQDLSAIPKFGVLVVDELPTENISSTTIYLTPRESESANGYPENYDEFLYVNGAWELLGCVSTNSDFDWITPDLPNPPLAGDSNPSVSVEVEEIEGGHRVSITTASGTQSFDVLDGTKGDKGDKGDAYTLTEADKTEIANAVLDALEVAEGGLY